ncbi:SDR family NAD(P)-dependent oxidoreductase [Gilvimarinus chinensis]|uniref:SDR family NAD(P)-dependent oxidoreductase n=1 Tax=Gilvimarinus chinensis TaxID=396005 RepID=UPI00036398F7|nr:SDR family NAD(P)-dependent oxidoreductase [Gilvimarinus chinensis]
MSTHTLAGRRVLVTGGSKGLGLACVKQLLEQGCDVYALARDTSTLGELKRNYGVQLRTFDSDITDLSSVNAVANQLEAIDTVILNAGTCEYLAPGQVDAELTNRVFEVNLQGSINVLNAVIDVLAASENAPHIVGISSLVTEVPLSRAEAYGASKAALDYYLNSLRVDLYHRGIDVSIVKPGFVKTPLTAKNDFPMPFIMEPEQAAEHVLKAVAQRRYLYKFPWQLALSLGVLKCLPTGFRVKIMQKMVRT